MKFISAIVITLLILNVSVPHELRAQHAATHVVSSDQLRAAVVARSAERNENIQQIQKLLSHDEVREYLGALTDLDKVERAIPTLDDETLADLSSESREVNDQIQAGMPWWGWAVLVVVIAAAVVGLSTPGVLFS